MNPTPTTDAEREALPPLPKPTLTFGVAANNGLFDEDSTLAYGKACFQAGRASLLEEMARVETWQPIETAPDKTPFSAIVASPVDVGGHYVEEAWWDYTRRQWWPANTDYSDSHGAPIYPTHWMPLPAPPLIPRPTATTESKEG